MPSSTLRSQMSQTSCNGHGLWKAFTRLSPATWKLVWKCWAPPCVKFFHWHANLDRCSKVERLACSIWPNWLPLACSTTPLAPCVTKPRDHAASDHRMPFRSAPTATATSLVTWWQEAKQDTPKSMHKGLTSPALLVPGMIWKQRHRCIFKHAQPSVSATTALIKEEALHWAKAGAHGLKSYPADDLGCSLMSYQCCNPSRWRNVNKLLPFQWNETQRSFAFSQKKN
jgi:hypothetical protein